MSIAAYASGIVISLLGLAPLAFAVYVAVAVMWFLPDRRVEHALGR